MATPAVIVSLQNEDSASPFTVTTASVSATTGDRMIVVTSEHDGSAAVTDLTAPLGWNLITSADNAANPKLQVSRAWYRDVQAGDSSFDFPYRSTADACCATFKITSFDSGVAPVGAAWADSAGSSSIDSPSVIPTNSDDLLLSIVSADLNNVAWDATKPGSMTDMGSTQVGSLYQGMQAAKETLASASATGVRTWTLSQRGDRQCAITIAVAGVSGATPKTLSDSGVGADVPT